MNINELKRQILASVEPKPYNWVAKGIQLAKEFCIADNKKTGNAFMLKEIFQKVKIPLEEEGDQSAGEHTNEAIEQLVEKGYFTKATEYERGLILTDMGYDWLQK